MPERIGTDTVRLLRQFGASGYGVSDLSAKFGLSRSCVSNILSGCTHASVVDDPDLPLLSEVAPPPDCNPEKKRPLASSVQDSPVDTPTAPTRPLGAIVRRPSPPASHPSTGPRFPT